MFKQSLILNILLLAFTSLLFTSCDKEDLQLEEEIITENFEGEFLKDMPYRQRCFRLQFPISVEFQDGSIATAASKAALHTIWKEWKENAGPNANRPQFVFPYDVKLKDGSIITVENKEEVAELLEECDIPGKRKRCFTLNFPVTIEFKGGSTFEAASAVALKRVLKEWRENNPDAMPEDYPTRVFPYDVTLRNGEVITINNVEDQKELRETCGELWSRWKCFKMIFPIKVALPNAAMDTVTIETPRGLRKAIKRWKENHASTDPHPKIVYPINIELANGDIITVNNREELGNYMNACTDLYGKRKCFKLAFPATIAFPDGSTHEVEDRDDMFHTLSDWKKANPDATERPTLAFPYDVMLKDGTLITVENEDDRQALKEKCD